MGLGAGGGGGRGAGEQEGEKKRGRRTKPNLMQSGGQGQDSRRQTRTGKTKGKQMLLVQVCD